MRLSKAQKQAMHHFLGGGLALEKSGKIALYQLNKFRHVGYLHKSTFKGLVNKGAIDAVSFDWKLYWGIRIDDRLPYRFRERYNLARMTKYDTNKPYGSGDILLINGQLCYAILYGMIRPLRIDGTFVSDVLWERKNMMVSC